MRTNRGQSGSVDRFSFKDVSAGSFKIMCNVLLHKTECVKKSFGALWA
jgi:hypothetical protein